MLMLTALIWGCAFVAQSMSMDYIDPFTFQCVRSLLGSAVLVPVFLILDRKKQNTTVSGPTREQQKTLWKAGLVCGSIMTVAANLQQIGIQYTTAAKAGFITAMYILLVPQKGLTAAVALCFNCTVRFIFAVCNGRLFLHWERRYLCIIVRNSLLFSYYGSRLLCTVGRRSTAILHSIFDLRCSVRSADVPEGNAKYK